MKEQEYKDKLQQIEDNYYKKKNDLYREFGLSQAIYKVGDIVSNRYYILLIDKIDVGVKYGLPYPIYSGTELTKKLTPKKSGGKVAIYGNDDKTVLIKGVENK